MPIQHGYRLISGREIIQEFWGPDAANDAAETAKRLRLAPYYIDAISREQPVEAMPMSGIAPGGALWYFDPSTGGFVVESEKTPMANDEVGREAYQLGQALAKIVAPGGTADVGALSVWGMLLAELKGYRDLRTGNQFVTSFMQGFQDETAPQKRLESGS